MIQLHYFPGNASAAPHILLEELGLTFELKYVDRQIAAHKSADYLKLNPNIQYFYPERWVNEGDTVAAAQVKAHAEAKVGGLLDQMDAHLASHGQDWFGGERYSVLDPFGFLLCRWTRGFARPARSRPYLGPYLQRMLARSAVRRAFATEKLAEPYV